MKLTDLFEMTIISAYDEYVDGLGQSEDIVIEDLMDVVYNSIKETHNFSSLELDYSDVEKDIKAWLNEKDKMFDFTLALDRIKKETDLDKIKELENDLLEEIVRLSIDKLSWRQSVDDVSGVMRFSVDFPWEDFPWGQVSQTIKLNQRRKVTVGIGTSKWDFYVTKNFNTRWSISISIDIFTTLQHFVIGTGIKLESTEIPRLTNLIIDAESNLCAYKLLYLQSIGVPEDHWEAIV